MHEDIRRRWLQPDRAVVLECASVADGIDLAAAAHIAADMADRGAHVRVVTGATTEDDMWARLAQHIPAPGPDYGEPNDDDAHHRIMTARVDDRIAVTADPGFTVGDLDAHLSRVGEPSAVWRALVVCQRAPADWQSILSLGVGRTRTTVVVITDNEIGTPDVAHARLNLGNALVPLGWSQFVPLVSWARVVADPYGGLVNTRYRVALDHGAQTLTLTESTTADSDSRGTA